MKKILFATVIVAVCFAWMFWTREAYTHNPVSTTVLFNREVAKIFESKCLQCHRADGMAMSLGTYAEARPWAVAIKEEILARRMPPWLAERGYGDFANDIGLTAREFDFLISWIDGGVPSGEGDDPQYVDHSDHWMLGEADALHMASESAVIETNSPAGFRRLIVDPGFTEDKWIRAIDYKPGDKRVSRAAFFTIAGTGQYLGGWTTWHPATELPEGVAFKVPAKSRIAIDVLYRGVSEPVTDRPSVALYFAKEIPVSPITNIVLRSQTAQLMPNGTSMSRATAEFRLPNDSTLFQLRPEMGPDGKSIEIKVRRPDGSLQVLLWIKNFRTDWQMPYIFRQPITLPKDSLILATAYYNPAGVDRAPREFQVTLSSYRSSNRIAAMASPLPLPASIR